MQWPSASLGNKHPGALGLGGEGAAPGARGGGPRRPPGYPAAFAVCCSAAVTAGFRLGICAVTSSRALQRRPQRHRGRGVTSHTGDALVDTPGEHGLTRSLSLFLGTSTRGTPHQGSCAKGGSTPCVPGAALLGPCTGDGAASGDSAPQLHAALGGFVGADAASALRHSASGSASLRGHSCKPRRCPDASAPAPGGTHCGAHGLHRGTTC
mmetsp:Transcript_12361/g.35073  ORF Transcript_12361/g.35073 Transcript_12361/m.35073 type:complete len:210 (-) Transcript_12361:317-946(-)